jgi:prepilin-type N-terminal cleavage/methylation domain-containing protein
MVQAAQREHRTIDRPPISSEKLMNKSFNKASQAGFTMIELIVVIVILGILAATAMPKFTSLSGDARKASLQAARGALSASSAMIHGKPKQDVDCRRGQYRRRPDERLSVPD